MSVYGIYRSMFKNISCSVCLFLLMISCQSVAEGTSTDPRQYGVFKSGGYVIGQVPRGTLVFKNEEDIPVNKTGKYIFGLGRTESGSQQLKYLYPDGKIEFYTLTAAARHYNIQKIDGLEASKVTPPETVIKRILAESREVRKIRSQQSNYDDWFRPFVWPSFGPVSGVYGSQRVLNGIEKTPHFGVDIANPRGAAVYAPNGGRIVLAKELYFSGNTVVIDHGLGVFSTLMHMDSIGVDAGKAVIQGEVLGTIGSTGRSTGPHLDWRMNWNNVRVDPSFFVPPMTDICSLESTSQARETSEAVILFHGLDRNSALIKQLGTLLMKQGLTVCIQGYPSTNYEIEQLSGYLANAVAIAKRSGFEKVHLVAHGLGGIIGRHYLRGRPMPGSGNMVMLSPENIDSELMGQFKNYDWFNYSSASGINQLSKEKANKLQKVNSPVGFIVGSSVSIPWFNKIFDTSAEE